VKVYGFDSLDVQRGDLQAAEVEAADFDFGLEAIARDLGWEFVSTRFKEARDELVERMTEEQESYPELIRAAKQIRASDVPITGGSL